MSENPSIFRATGKRKSAVAQVRLRIGEGNIVINERRIDEYFGRETSRMIVQQPFDVIEAPERYDVNVLVRGGGIAAQATAIRHGVARALLAVNEGFRTSLKRAGFLTRDAREVERKKYGHHKARKRPQYSKR